MGALFDTHAIYRLAALDPVTGKIMPGTIMRQGVSYNPHPNDTFLVNMQTELTK